MSAPTVHYEVADSRAACHSWRKRLWSFTKDVDSVTCKRCRKHIAPDAPPVPPVSVIAREIHAVLDTVPQDHPQRHHCELIAELAKAFAEPKS